MKMVSAAKLRKATDRIVKMRPYANKMQEMLSNIASGSGVNIALAAEREIRKVLLVVVTSDRGLAGAFNSTIVKLTKALIEEKYSALAKAGKVYDYAGGEKSYRCI
jgi:F-type H+-transporting ATPase subunit gamma